MRRVEPASLRAGLQGFNGVLVGLALATFIAPGPLLWAYVLVCVALAVAAAGARSIRMPA
jgi:urea transporter